MKQEIPNAKSVGGNKRVDASASEAGSLPENADFSPSAPVFSSPDHVSGSLAEDSVESKGETEEIPGLNLEAPGGEPGPVEALAKHIRLKGPGQGYKRSTTLTKPVEATESRAYSPTQRILILDAWLRSGLPAGDFGPLVGVSNKTLYRWRKMFDEYGPEGLDETRKTAKPPSSKLPEYTKRAILMIKERHPDYGVQRISDMLARGPALPASPATIARVLHEAGYQSEEMPTTPHKEPVKSFERSTPNQMWQTDIFTFILKRQNRRVYMVIFMDDHSRFIVGYGIGGSASAALVIETLRNSIVSFQPPEEVLTDNGAQYITWRGKSQFSRECEKLGVKQIVSRPKHPQTLGKVERFWGTLWRDFLCGALFLDLDDARRRIGLFIDHYNFQRPHQGIDGLTPADRYFGMASEVLKSMRSRLQANALELAKFGVPKKPFYITGQLGGKPFSLHTEGDRIYLIQEGGKREEVNLVTPSGTAPEEDPQDHVPGPGDETLDEGIIRIAGSMADISEEEE